METNIAVFRGKEIRKTIHMNEWWFSIIDVIEVLTGSDRPRKYWNDLKKKLLQEGYEQLSEKIGQLKMPSADGKFYATDCANTETIPYASSSDKFPEDLRRHRAIGDARLTAMVWMGMAGWRPM